MSARPAAVQKCPVVTHRKIFVMMNAKNLHSSDTRRERTMRSFICILYTQKTVVLRACPRRGTQKTPCSARCCFVEVGRIGVSSLIRCAHKWLLPGLACRKATWHRLSILRGSKAVCFLHLQHKCKNRRKGGLHLAVEVGRIELPSKEKLSVHVYDA